MPFSISRLYGSSALAAVSQGVLASVIIAAANILAGIVTARYLGASGRGELAALITLPAFFSFVMTFGLPSGLVYHARRSAKSMDSLIAAVLTMSIAAGVVGAIAAYIATPYILTELSPSLIPVARALAVFAVLGVLSQITMAVLQAQHRFLAYNYIRISQPFFQLTGTLVLALLGWLTPLSAALVVLLAGLPGLLWALKWIFQTLHPVWTGWIASARAVSLYSLRAYGGELLLGMSTQVDKVIVVGIFAPSMMGIYVVALSLSRIVTMFPAAVVTVLFPKASGRSESEVIQITSKAAAGTTLLVGVTATILIIVGPVLLRFFYGQEFEAAGMTFRLLIIEAAIASVVQVLSQAFMALNRPGLVTLQYGSGVAVAVPLLFILAPVWGAEGAAAALLVASIVRLACTYWCFTGVMKIAAPKVFGEMGASISTLKTALLAALR